MPYSIPVAASPLPIHSHDNPRHRRSNSVSVVDGGPGAFTPMTLPRRKTAATSSPARFHLKTDDGEDSSPSDDEVDAQDVNLPPKTNIVAAPGAVSFPRSFPVSTRVPPQAKVPFPINTSTRPSFSRATSTHTHFSNEKPLKSSLKSSSSSPNIPFPSQSLVSSTMHHHNHNCKHHKHLRAASAPSAPPLLPSPPPSPASEASKPPQTPSLQPKNVHFPSQEGRLATVKLFKLSGRPAALYKPDEETETETEGESSSTWGYSRGATYPCPRIDRSSSPLARKVTYELDGVLTSPVPASSAVGNVHLESLAFSSSGTQLTGTLIVRNLAYEKTVAVRFTLDEWDTTSEVLAKYVESLAGLPDAFLSLPPPTTSPLTVREGEMGGWDRFGFTIRLQNYAHNLAERTMWLVARFTTEGSGEGKEWWDNNGGGNYRVAFRMCVENPQERKRQVALSAPPAFPLPTQISSSASAPPSWTAPSYPTLSNQTSPPRTPPMTAKAQTTLSHLKKLNLRNYAAPGSVGAAAAPSVVAYHAMSSHDSGLSSSPSSSPPSISSPLALKVTEASASPTISPTKDPASSLTSTPLTSPLHTPEGEHTHPFPLVAEHAKEESEEGVLPASLSRFSPRKGVGMGMDIVGGFPASVISSVGVGTGSEISMSGSPPLSSFIGGAAGGGAGEGFYWS